MKVMEAEITQLVFPDRVMRFRHAVGAQADRRKLQGFPSHDAHSRASKNRVLVGTSFEEVTRRIKKLSSTLTMISDAL